MARRLSGFTLIEAVVLTAIVALLAAAVTPNAIAFVQSQELRSFESQLEALASIGRERAIALAQPVQLEFDSTKNAFSLHSTDTSGNDQVQGNVSVPKGLQPQRFLLGTQDSDASDWKLTFYPDGSSDGGGVQLNEQSLTVSLLVDATTGTSDLLQDQLPDTTTLSWTSGDIIHRAQS